MYYFGELIYFNYGSIVILIDKKEMKLDLVNKQKYHLRTLYLRGFDEQFKAFISYATKLSLI